MAQRLLQAYDDIGDSTQCHRKTCITTALGGLMGAIGSAYSVYSTRQIPTWKQGPGRAGPGHVHGCTGGLTLGACAHSYGTAAVGCIYMDTAATLFKISKLEGWQFFATPKV
ncbi:NADH dehydrogenase [ubiquinone] 1 alpha subcomplex subunit 11-like [Peromyscus eremicus]|uniref:NADH dehydrogenase [ubiquinone] 1 alpha subcomplex subunit 11-like n=1 Tax=Peromyscus eremicus TaxID=42410 RepID=UPI0027DDD6C2|nr:NADH dehydrogenase [ubiquinone] 1 alpha subcomplex subunit 11-like [Peromyscus eremicus]